MPKIDGGADSVGSAQSCLQFSSKISCPFPTRPNLPFGPTEEEGIAIAPDGKSLVTSAGIRQESVWLHDASGDRQISSEGSAALPGLGLGGGAARSVFSPDGKKLFYLARKEGSRACNSGELWMADLESGRTEGVLSSVLMNDFDLAPDGKRVAFSSPWVRQIDSASIVILDPHGCILSSKKLPSGTSEEYKIDVQ